MLKRQFHVAQIALGLNQHQRAGIELRCCRALTRNVDRFGFSGHGSLHFGNFAGVGVDPLQTGRAGNLGQVLQRQVVGLDFWQGARCWRGGRRRNDRRCNNGSCWSGHWRSTNGFGSRYQFRSYWRTLLLGYRLIRFKIFGRSRCALRLAFSWRIVALATVPAITVTAAALARLALLTILRALLLAVRTRLDVVG